MRKNDKSGKQAHINRLRNFNSEMRRLKTTMRKVAMNVARLQVDKELEKKSQQEQSDAWCNCLKPMLEGMTEDSKKRGK